MDITKGRRAYQILGLREGAPVEDIKRAYRDLALVHHPDKNMNDPTATDRFKELSLAYQLLTNPDRKRLVDAAFGASAAATAAPAATSSCAFARSESAFQQEMSNLRASRTRTASAAGGPRAPSGAKRMESQYSAEQQEVFRQRAKERERELCRRREKERDEQREREVARLKKAQEDKLREEERKRREADRVQEKLHKILFESAGAATPRTPVKVPEEVQRQSDRLDRIRLEKQRQDAVRRREQERLLERKLESLRAREECRAKELEEAEQDAFRNRLDVIETNEAEDRAQCLEMEEAYERGLVGKAFQRVRDAYILATRQRHVASMEQFARQERIVEQVVAFAHLQLLAKEGAERAVLLRDSRFLYSRTTLLAQRERQTITSWLGQRATLLASALSERGHLHRLEALQRNFVAVLADEWQRRHTTRMAECREWHLLGRSKAQLACQLLVEKQLRHVRRTVEAEEAAERGTVRILRDEERARLRLQGDEHRCFSNAFRALIAAINSDMWVARERLSAQEALQREAARESGELADEVARLQNQIRQVSADLRAERSRVVAASAANSEPSQCAQCARSTDAVGAGCAPDVQGKDKEIEVLRQRLELFESAADNRELIALLCGENRRLLDANAKLAEENWRLLQANAATPTTNAPVRARVWNSPLQHR